MHPSRRTTLAACASEKRARLVLQVNHIPLQMLLVTHASLVGSRIDFLENMHQQALRQLRKSREDSDTESRSSSSD